MDIAVEFSGNDVSGNGNNNSSYDKYPVGWSFTNSVRYNNQELLRWGGDATGGQGETALMRQCWKEMLILPVKLSLMYMQLGLHLVVLLIK